ncbi:MAG: aminodeoxychorismate lyase, partial [Pseudomonadota bacterium]|nr:aminodeoxychorismate lyase [Pseudomonadota bacterium]
RLYGACERLSIEPPDRMRLRKELMRIASRRSDGVLKLIVTRGVGTRSYRTTGLERCTRIVSWHPLPAAAACTRRRAVRVRICGLRIGSNELLAGLKTLNRLESVMARAEWTDDRIWEGLLRDRNDHIICGTMSNLFMRRGSLLLTPAVDRCGVAGVMRRWVRENAAGIGLRVRESRVRGAELAGAEEIFLTNAVVGIMPVRRVDRIRGLEDEPAALFREHGAARGLQALLEGR